ncbi:molecular chaperone Hsp90 [Herbidospora galbida]|uniref:Molecular chaperone Hsp90 n=1 Tax=Herbidospora galbida TaxID=2575442 RepID=A0A4U3MI42_9ACTN|nr:SRPBCC family protein [Herbidospora galbida]TKK89025.1 molecular chaperone Hsp90 [Herbidospora galbida]
MKDLHTEYAMKGRIDDRAPVRNTSSIEIDASPAEVWALLSDLRGWERWWPEHKVLELGEIAPGERYRWRLGGVKISSRFAVVTEGRELTWSGVVLGLYRAVDRNLVEPLPGGRTRMTISESLAGPLAGLLYPAAKLRAGHERFLDAIKKEAER